jgi:hypothetical protein
MNSDLQTVIRLVTVRSNKPVASDSPIDCHVHGFGSKEPARPGVLVTRLSSAQDAATKNPLISYNDRDS